MVALDDLKSFLLPTEYCDFNNPEIQKIANGFKLRYSSQKELAIAFFLYVRDNIKYYIGPWNKKASEVLLEGEGMCTNSTNLLVALLRAVGIPAGYCIYKVRGGDSFGHIIPLMIKNRIRGKSSVHIVCFVYLNGRWIKCDASTDKELSNSSSHISHLTQLINWDGESDAVHLIDPKEIISISGPLANIDFQLKKRPRYIVKQHIFHIGKLYISFLRETGPSHTSHIELQQQFKEWLKRNHFLRYHRYKIAYYFYEMYYKFINLFKKNNK